MNQASILKSIALVALLASPGFAQAPADQPSTGGGTASFLLPPALPQGGGGGSQSGSGGSPYGNIGDRFRTVDRNAPDREDMLLINLGNKHVDGIFGGMGESSGFGGGIRFTTADSLPGVEFAASAIGTFKGYRQFQGDVIVGEVGNEGTHFDASFRYRRRTKDNFFGLGPKVGPEAPIFVGNPGILLLPSQSESFETNFDTEERRTSASLYHDFTDRFQAGVYVAYRSTSSYEGADDADPPIGSLFGPVGINFCQFFGPNDTPMCFSRVALPGLFTGSKILSEGVYAEYDGRNNDDGLTKGFYFYGRLANHDGRGRNDGNPSDILGPLRFVSGGSTVTITFPDRDFNDFGWFQSTLDVRGFIPLGSDKTSLALRTFMEFNDTKGGSTIPFYYLPTLGGRTTLRGFETFRFRGENVLLFQGEFRQTIHTFDDDSKFGKGVDVIVLGDLGQVWGLDRPGDFDSFFGGEDFDGDNYEADFGFGLQYRYNKQFAIRVDYAHSNEGDKVWFSFNRVF
jgi:hypothetical protein